MCLGGQHKETYNNVVTLHSAMIAFAFLVYFYRPLKQLVGELLYLQPGTFQNTAKEK